jgi:hypothetical protein
MAKHATVYSSLSWRQRRLWSDVNSSVPRSRSPSLQHTQAQRPARGRRERHLNQRDLDARFLTRRHGVIGTGSRIA